MQLFRTQELHSWALETQEIACSKNAAPEMAACNNMTLYNHIGDINSGAARRRGPQTAIWWTSPASTSTPVLHSPPRCRIWQTSTELEICQISQHGGECHTVSAAGSESKPSSKPACCEFNLLAPGPPVAQLSNSCVCLQRSNYLLPI